MNNQPDTANRVCEELRCESIGENISIGRQYILIGRAEKEGGPFRRGRRRREHKDLYSDHLDQYIKQLNPEVLIVYRKRIGGISVNYMWVMDNGIHNSN